MADVGLTVPTTSIQIKPGDAGWLLVLIPYDPKRVAKIKTVVGRRWHHQERCWTVPHTDRALAHLLVPHQLFPANILLWCGTSARGAGPPSALGLGLAEHPPSVGEPLPYIPSVPLNGSLGLIREI